MIGFFESALNTQTTLCRLLLSTQRRHAQATPTPQFSSHLTQYEVNYLPAAMLMLLTNT